MVLDVSIIFKVATIGIIITVICLILKKSDRDDIAMFVSILGIIIVLGLVVKTVAELFNDIKQIFGLF
jgi:stage III sporulation protein AC